MMRQDPLLGYAPKASTTVTDRKRWGDDLMWDVTYTIDDRGLRMTPRSDDSSDCVLFFGGSFTFGSGIDDDETLAYQVAVRTPEDLRVYNFGVGGYGAHQVLTAIEHGIADQAIDCDRESVRQVIYQGIWQHAARVAGLVKWDDHGPRYALDDNGEVTFQGHFDDGLRKIWRAVAKLAIKSEIYQRVTGAGKHFRRLDEDDFDLYVALVARVRDVVRERYPCAAFDVLYWDTTEAESRAILQRFGARGFRTHRVSTILPGFYDPEEGLVYKIHPNDGHPNAFANQRLADYVMGTILPAGSSCRQAELNP